MSSHSDMRSKQFKHCKYGTKIDIVKYYIDCWDLNILNKLKLLIAKYC